MPQVTHKLLALNRGIMSTLALARVDLKRTALAAETMTNWMPRVLGPMSLRPGLEYIGTTYNNAVSRSIPFVFSATSTAILELTDSLMRVLVSDVLLTRPSVSTTFTNGTFTTDLTGWTDADESSASSVWATGDYLSLTGTGANAAIRTQTLSIGVADRNVEHALRVVVQRGPVLLRVGSSAGGDEYITERTLRTGTHSLAFTPAGASVYIQLLNRRKMPVLVDSIAIEGSGVVTLPTPWTVTDLDNVRYSQSADVVFVACSGFQQRRIERWDARSWSVVKYEPEDGPFRLINTSETTISSSATTGSVTLTASKALFKSTHVGALFRLTSTGQRESATVTGADQYTSEILINGVGGERRVAVSITGTWTGTVRLQYSIGSPGSWIDVENQSWSSNTSTSYTDDLDGQIIYYRLGIKAGEYGSGTASIVISCSSGSSTGIVRVTSYSSATSVGAVVIENLGGTAGTSDWYEGAWSDYRGWPTAVALHEGRLWWAGKANLWSSESDGYESFDDFIEGDSGPVSRSLGEGPVDVINWLLALGRLMVGTASAELNVRSNALDEPLTPTNFSIKPSSTQGSAGLAAERIDTMGAFVQFGGKRVYLIGYDPGQADYVNDDATQLVPDLFENGIVCIKVQRQPDTRIHCVRDDGTVGVLVFDKVEDVMCWCVVETDGDVEDVCVLPGVGESQVYYTVKRTINGSTVRYREKWALTSECVGGTLNKQADSFYEYSGASTSTISGLSHLEGETVVAWGAGKDLGTYTVSGGSITLSQAVTSCIVGLPYTAQFKSMKLGLASLSTGEILPVNLTARVDHIGLVLVDTHKDGLTYGPDFSNLDALPALEEEAAVADDYVWTNYDQNFIPFNGTWTTDNRICLEAQAPRPCTVLAIQARMSVSP